MAKSLIQLAQENKQAYINACNAVIGKGGTVPSGMPASELANAITNIPSYQALAWQTVESNSKRVTVPSGVMPMAQLKKIGGMTHKSNNLLNPVNMSLSFDGGTITENGDGSITLNGSGSLWLDFYYGLPRLDVYAEDYYFTLNVPVPEGCIFAIWGYDSDDPEDFENEGEITCYAGETVSVALRGGAGRYVAFIQLTGEATFSNLTLKPMLSKGSPMEFEPYFEGLRDSKVESIVSKGLNHFDVSKAVNANFVDNGDGTYTLTHNGGTQRFSATVPLDIPANTQIAFKGNVVGGDATKYGMDFKFADGATSSTVGLTSASRTRTYDKDVISARIYIESSEVGKSVIYSDIQIVYGEKATDYKPFVGVQAVVDIPEAVKALDGFGLGINADYYNYVEWRDGRCYLVQTCKKLVFNGTEGWYAQKAGTENQFFALEGFPMPANANTALMSEYNRTTIGSTNTLVGWQLLVQANPIFRLRPANVLTDFPTVADWKSYLAERYANGNPLEFIYALAEPIETDITDLMTIDNHIAVEGGGPIEFNNEYGYDIPNEINYLFNTAGG